MPIHLKYDKEKGFFYYQYGNIGHKYYFSSPSGENIAYNKALRQSNAIHMRKSKYII